MSLAQLMRIDLRLRHVLYVSYLVPAERLRSLLPGFLSLSTIQGGQAFLSCVVIQNWRAHPRLLPLAGFTFNQINLRTYVKDPRTGRQAVFFLRSGVDLSGVPNLPGLIGFPVDKISCRIEDNKDDKGRFSYQATGIWERSFVIAAEEAGRASSSAFGSAREMTDLLILPQVGFYKRQNQVWRLPAWHPEVAPVPMALKEMRLKPVEDCGLVGGLSAPDNVLLTPDTAFRLYPPSMEKAAD